MLSYILIVVKVFLNGILLIVSTAYNTLYYCGLELCHADSVTSRRHSVAGTQGRIGKDLTIDGIRERLLLRARQTHRVNE